QLDRTGSKYLQSRLEKTGIDFELDAKVRELSGKESSTSAILDTGKRIETDLTLISAGVSPRTDLARDAGLETEKGILVDKNLRTSGPDIFAAGDAIEQNGRCYGIWPPAQEQGKIAGRNLLGKREEYDGSLSYYQLKVAGIDLISAGVRDEVEADKTLIDEEKANQEYKKFFLNESGELIGAILVGDKACYPTVLNGLRNRTNFYELNEEHELVD
ncbi:MAG: NAD(P)/FAD-dependent oxidoreductase, partial [Candidatus Bipolaricaulia bacterium]